MTCRACRGPITSWKATFAIRGAACCGPRANRGKRGGRGNARAHGNSCPTPRQRPSYRRPSVTSHPRTWRRSGSVLPHIASVSACRVVPCAGRKRNSINCVSSGPYYHLQAQGDFCGIAAVGAMDGLGRKVGRAIECDQQLITQHTKVVEQAVLLETLEDLLKHG